MTSTDGEENRIEIQVSIIVFSYNIKHKYDIEVFYLTSWILSGRFLGTVWGK